MKTTEPKLKTCPLCGNEYSAPSALSREDVTMHICPDCGIREALTSIGVCIEEQNKIIDIVHRNTLTAE